MKKAFTLLAIICITTTAFTVIKKDNKDIIGKWKVDNSSLNNYVRGVIENTRKVSPEQAEQMDQNLDMVSQIVSNLEFNYKPDNTLEVLNAPGGTQTSKWRLSDDGKNIFITPNNKPERKDSILELNSTKLRIINSEKKDTILYTRS